MWLVLWTRPSKQEKGELERKRGEQGTDVEWETGIEQAGTEEWIHEYNNIMNTTQQQF